MTNFQLLLSFIRHNIYTLIICFYHYQWGYKDYSTTMIWQHHFKPYQEVIVEFINWSMRSVFHQLTTITNHTIIVPGVRCHILFLLLMMLSSSPASQHNFLYQVPKGDLLITFIPISRLQIPHQTTVIFFWLCPVVSWCCGNHCCYAFVLWCGYCFSVFCITSLNHQSLVIAPIRNTSSRGQKCWDLSSDIRGISNDDSNSNENGKKAVRFGLEKNNNFARASCFFGHFLAVVARLQHSQTSLIQTAKGQNQVSSLQTCPYYRGRECMIFGFSGTKRTVCNREVSAL